MDSQATELVTLNFNIDFLLLEDNGQVHDFQFLLWYFEFYNIYVKDNSKVDVIFMINIVSCNWYYLDVLNSMHFWISLGKNFKTVRWRHTDFLCFSNAFRRELSIGQQIPILSITQAHYYRFTFGTNCNECRNDLGICNFNTSATWFLLSSES